MEKLKCLVCGMKISDANYDFNNATCVNKNTNVEIINCPFCGVSMNYLSVDEEIYSVNVSELNKETIKILDMAMKLEVFNGDFYEVASKLAKNEHIKELFKQLSNIEYMHAKIHKKLGGFKEFPNLKKPDYSRHNTDEQLLNEAYKREKHAIAFYNRYLEKISNNILKEVLKALSSVEKEHMIITEP